VYRDIEARSRNDSCCGKTSTTYRETKNVCVCVCVCVTLVTQHATYMRHFMLLSVLCPALPNFSSLCNKYHNFRWWGTVAVHKTCVCFSLRLLCETFLILRRIRRNIIIMYTRLHVNYPLFLSYFNETLGRVSKNTQTSKFMKIRPLGAEFFYAHCETDRQTGPH